MTFEDFRDRQGNDLLSRNEFASRSFYAGAASRDAEIAELKADAERYRWLCEQNEKGVGFFALPFAARNIMVWKTKAEIDNGIDRARSTK